MDAGTLTVGELARGVDAALTTWFAGELWVTGEIADLRRSNHGHAYFQLVEREGGSRNLASIDVALFDSARRYVNSQLKAGGGVRMTDGMQVRIRGRIEFYAPQGRVQLRMSGIDPAYTLALLVSERDRVVARLDADGLLSRNAATTLVQLPLRVGLATSDGSAAMADFVDELRASGFAWQIRLVHVPVQGHGADELIARAIDQLIDEDVDVVVLVRGGGSRLDLSTFDSETLGRAIAASPVPVLTGVGHEIDTSVADVAAHTSYKTPTACAAALVGRVRDGWSRADQLWSAIPPKALASSQRLDSDLTRELRSLPRVARARVQAARARIDASSRAAGPVAMRRLGDEQALRQRQVHLLAPSVRRSLERAERRLDVLAASADGADPSRLMRRGWSIMRTSKGTVVRSPRDVTMGDRLTTSMADGAIESDVVRVVAPADTNEGEPDDSR